MKMQNKSYALPFHQLDPYYLTLEVNWNKETSNFRKIFNPKLSWRDMRSVVTGFFWELVQIFQSAPNYSVGSQELHGELREELLLPGAATLILPAPWKSQQAPRAGTPEVCQLV